MDKNNLIEKAPRIKDGVFTVNGKHQFFASADYPYFRDDPANWPDRLEKLKRIGHTVITIYIPWRHHDLLNNGQRQYDFTGKTLASRNVIGFIRLCQEKGLSLVIKPGPFVHGELNYGGLPDFVCPLKDPRIEPMTGSDGVPFPWPGANLVPGGQEVAAWPLPAPFDPIFQQEVRAWMRAISQAILEPFAYPQGPILLVQIANEGIYSNHQRAVWAYDFSPSSLALFRDYLRKKYGQMDEYNRLHQSDHRDWSEIEPPRAWQPARELTGLMTYADWSDYQVDYIGQFYARLRAEVPASLPCVLNVNPPTADWFGIDAWLTRINPDRWPEVHYGFTNWIGVACDDRTVIDRYQVMVKRARGANYEENWGFSKLYDPAFAFDSVSFFQTMIEVASGATGYNIYTGVGTAHTPPELDITQRGPYPDVSPIDDQGRITSKGEIVRKMNKFFASCQDFVETRPAAGIAWGLYLPYNHVRAWVPEVDQSSLNPLGVGEGGRAFMHFERRMLDHHRDFGLVNLQAVPLSQLQGYRTLVLAAGRWMDSATQKKLADYVRGGGRLLLIGDLPELDETLRPNQQLRPLEAKIHRLAEDEFFCSADWMRFALENTEADVRAINQAAERSLIWLYRHPTRDAQYLFVFSGKDPDSPVDFEYAAGDAACRVKVVLPGKSAGVLRVEGRHLTAVLIKGANDYTGEVVTPSCEINGVVTRADSPGDWLVV